MTAARAYPDTPCPFCRKVVRVTRSNAFYAHQPRPDQPKRNGRCLGSGAYAYARRLAHD